MSTIESENKKLMRRSKLNNSDRLTKN